MLARWLFVITLTANAAVSRSLPAQASPPPLPASFTSDSVAWQRVIVFIVGSLTNQLVLAAADSSPQPWRLLLPPDEPQRQLLERQLRTILRARDVTESDTLVNTLDIGPLRIVGDTARVRVRTDFTRRCAGTSQTTGFGNVDSVFVVRHPQQKFWGVARSPSTRHGDRVGCPRGRD